MKSYRNTLTRLQHKKENNTMSENPNIQALQEASIKAEAVKQKQEREKSDRLNTMGEKNQPLEQCIGECQIKNDFTSEKAKTSLRLRDLDTMFKEQLKTIELDTTQTTDAKILLADDVLQAARNKFSEIVVEQIEKIGIRIEQAKSQLFTSNSKLSDADLVFLGNAKFVDKILEAPFDYADNEANANVIMHLYQRGLYRNDLTAGADGGALVNGLNRRHTRETYDNLKILSKNARNLKAISDRQTETFRKLSHPASTVNAIRERKFKGIK